MRLDLVIQLSGLMLAMPLAMGCGDDTGSESSSGGGADAVLEADPAASEDIQIALTKAITEASHRYSPLEYEYNEDLLQRIDQIEAHLADEKAAPPPRFILPRKDDPPKLDETEEIDHYRETVRRWEAQTGRKLRAAIDPLKAEVAARKAGDTVPPEFHQRFSAVFDDLIKLEVLEMRERRNRAIHEAAEPVFAKYRKKQPELVRYYEQMLNTQGYAPPEPADRKEQDNAGP